MRFGKDLHAFVVLIERRILYPDQAAIGFDFDGHTSSTSILTRSSRTGSNKFN
jgi:hypothetical protein